MRKDTPNESIIALLKEKIPNHAKLTNFLTDLLILEKEAVYRRLRGEVPFPFSEIVAISRKLNFSLDNLCGTISPRSRPFQMKLVEHYEPTTTDYVMLQEYVDVIKSARTASYSEFGSISSILPVNFIARYPLLYRLYMMKWMYQYEAPGTTKKYTEIYPTQQIVDINNAFLKEIQNISFSYFIFDQQLFYYIVNDIKYFHSIHLLSEEDVHLLKKELFFIIDDLEQLMAKGCWSNGNKIQIHFSTLHFETTYNYFQTDGIFLTMIQSYALNAIASTDEMVFNKMKMWIQSLKRTSVLLSESGEIQRLLFLEKQRSYIEGL